MIVRGTTPSFTFLLPEFDGSIDHGLVSFTQDKVVKIHKEFTGEEVDYTDVPQRGESETAHGQIFRTCGGGRRCHRVLIELKRT